MLPEDTGISEKKMVSFTPSDASVKTFVNSPFIQKATGVQNINNLPMGEFLRLMTNAPPEVPTQNIPGPSTSVGTPPMSSVIPPEMTNERLAAAGPQGILPWDFYIKNPNFAGGVMKVANEIPRWDLASRLNSFGMTVPEMNREEMLSTLELQPGQGGKISYGSLPNEQLKKEMDSRGLSYFKMSDEDMKRQLFKMGGDIAGKLYTLVEPAKKGGFEAGKNALIDKYMEMATAAFGGKTANPMDQAAMIDKLAAHIPSLIAALTGEEQNPSVIKRNLAEANRGTVSVVPTGPEGQHGAFLNIPGQPLQQFATGVPSVSARNDLPGMLNQGYIEFMKESARIDADPMIQPEQKTTAHAALQERFRQYANGLQQAFGQRQPASSPTGKMTYQDFYAKAKAGGYTDAQINAEWPKIVQKGLGG